MIRSRFLALVLVTGFALVGAAGPVGAALDPLNAQAGWATCDEEARAFDVLPAPLAPAEDDVVDACSGLIRPGARMTAPVGCTYNWVVKDDLGDLYIGTAGHCVSEGTRVAAGGVGYFGTVVYSSCCGAGNDFALIKIDADRHDLVNPTMCRWGGPVSTGFAERAETLLVYGFGIVYGEAAESRARAGITLQDTNEDISYVGMMQPGDSGAPVMTEAGEAVGVHVMSSVGTPVGVRVDPSPKYATGFQFALDNAAAAMGRTLTLVTSEEPVNVLGV